MDDLDHTRLMRRLLFWNRFFLALLLLGALLAGASWKVRDLYASTRELKVAWQDDGSVELGATSDGPFVVTHLALPVDSLLGVRAVAPLPRALAIIDSNGSALSQAEVARLSWLDTHGRKLRPPTPGTPLSALYFEPKIARPR